MNLRGCKLVNDQFPNFLGNANRGHKLPKLQASKAG